jgi:hypothetical protein
LSIGRAPLWRAFRQFVAALIVAIIPQPDLDALRANAQRIGYRLRERRRRKRKLQTMPPLAGLALS